MADKKLKALVVAAARPNFMKIAPLMAAFDARNGRSDTAVKFDARLVHTGQHYDANMSDVFFTELGMRPPDINLEVGSGSHAVQTANVMLRFEPVCLEQKPDWIIVVGDVNSTMACALVGAKLNIKTAHVESGLRSRDRTMPEEVNRLVTDAIADLLLTPSEDADENLRNEGVPAEKIRMVGNIMIDSLRANLSKSRASDVLSRLSVTPGNFALVTLHRPGNVDEPAHLRDIVSHLSQLGEHLPVVFPMHPRTRKMLDQHRIPVPDASRVRVTDPVGYHDSLRLAEDARLVLTDSGGLQEETTYFRTPCLTLRPNTERPVTVTIGSNRLTTLARLREDIKQVLSRPTRFGELPPYWDGKTAERIVEALVEFSA